MNDPTYPAHWHELALAYLDDRLSEVDRHTLAALADNPLFYRCLAEHALDASALYRLGRLGALLPAEAEADGPLPKVLEECQAERRADPPMVSRGSLVRHPAVLTTFAASACVLLLAALGVWWISSSRQPAEFGKVVQSTGRVVIRGASGERSATTAKLREGETLATQDVASSAVLELPSGTRITLAGNTTLLVRPGDKSEKENGQKVVVDAGQITAQVTPQPADAPFCVGTQNAEVRVLGTEFQLSAAADLTRLDVTKGTVMFTRLCDQQSVQVADGQYAVARDERADLEAREIAVAPDKFEAAFEDGLPFGWRAGEWWQADLPAGSRGAVRAARPQAPKYGNDEHYEICTNNAWSQAHCGLFSIHEDSYLNLTYTMHRPEWFQIILGTRAADGRRQNFEVPKGEPWWKFPAGQWRTLSIPLNRLDDISKRRQPSPIAPTPVGREAYFLLVSSQEHDRELVIDRLWVTRGLPREALTPSAERFADGSVIAVLAP